MLQVAHPMELSVLLCDWAPDCPTAVGAQWMLQCLWPQHPMPLFLSSAMPITAAFILGRDLSIFHLLLLHLHNWRWNCSCSAFIIFLICAYYLEIILKSGSRQNIPCLTSKNCLWGKVLLTSGVSFVANQYKLLPCSFSLLIHLIKSTKQEKYWEWSLNYYSFFTQRDVGHISVHRVMIWCFCVLCCCFCSSFHYFPLALKDELVLNRQLSGLSWPLSVLFPGLSWRLTTS